MAGPRHVPAGTKPPRPPRVVDPMDPKAPLVIDGKPILSGAMWSGAYFLYDMAAEMWLEETSGRPISYFEPSAGRDRPIRDSLLWYIAGLRDWHRDGYDEHPAEDDLTVHDLEKLVTQRTITGLSYCANMAWRISIPNEMAERMAAQQKEAAVPVILAALSLGWTLDKVLEAAQVPMSAFLSWQVTDDAFRDNVAASMAAAGAGQGGMGVDALQGRTGPENGAEADPDADPLAGRRGSVSGRTPSSSSASTDDLSGS